MGAKSAFNPAISFAAILFVMCAGPLSTGYAKGTLDTLRSDVRSPRDSEHDDDDDDDESSHSHSHHYHDHDHHHHDHGDSDSVFGQVLGWMITSPFWAPRQVAGDGDVDRGYFHRYPYQRDQDGYMPDDPWFADETYDWVLRTRVEYADDLDALTRFGGQVLLDTSSRWGLESEVNRRHEAVNAGPDDNLWTGDANVVFRFAQSPQLQMRAGIGFNWLSDTFGSDFGFNFTYSGDWFPTNPFIISTEIDWGRLGRAGLFHGRISGGLQFHRFEIYTGYDYYDVGSVQIDGLIGGVRIWY